MYQDFSSMPPEQEREFVVFEQFTRESAKKAIQVGGIVAGIYLLLMIVVVMSHDKPKPLIEGEDIADVESSPSTAPDPVTPTPTPTPTPSPAAETPTPSPAAAPAEGAATPPAPPAGATKAPPTAIVPK